MEHFPDFVIFPAQENFHFRENLAIAEDMRSVRTPRFEVELFDFIGKVGLSLGPVTFTPEDVQSPELGHADGVLRARVEGSGIERRFVFECKTHWTPRSRVETVERLRQSYGQKFIPLLVAPYLSESVLDSLRHQNISAIDVCGNGLLMDPPGFFVLRTGAKRQPGLAPPSGRPSIYDSSHIATLVPRVFFSQQIFPTTTAVLEACHERMMPRESTSLPLVLSTVSKALRELDEDLVTDRSGRERCLRDPARLLENLQRSFRLPQAPSTSLKSKLSFEEIWMRLDEQRPRLRSVVTGRGSASHHTGLAGPERIQLYVSDLRRAVEALEAKPTQAFPNLEITQTLDEAPYFDARFSDADHYIPWSSPLQCYLELTRVGADPRERDVAEKLRTELLRAARPPNE